MRKKEFLYLCLFTISVVSIEPKTKAVKDSKEGILVLYKTGKYQREKDHYGQKLIHFLGEANQYDVESYPFRNASKLDSLLEENKSYAGVYVLPGPLSYLRPLSYHEELLALRKKLAGMGPIFYFDEKSYFIKLVYHSFLKYVMDFQIVQNAGELTKKLDPNITSYHTYEFDYDKNYNQLYLPQKNLEKTDCLSYKKSDAISIRRIAPKKPLYELKPPALRQAFKNTSLFHCFFEDQTTKEKIVYEISYPLASLHLFPREVLLFYEPKRIIEKHFSITSELPVESLEFFIQVKKQKGKQPLIFSSSQKWNWDAQTKMFHLLPLEKKYSGAHSKRKYDFDLAVLGGKDHHLIGNFQIKSKNILLAELPLSFRPYSWGGNFFSWFLIYLAETIYMTVLAIFIFLFFILKKRKIIQKNIKPGVSLGQFVFMIKKPQKFFLSKNENPFNCAIPFVDEGCTIQVDGAFIDIETENRKKVSFNLSESLGKAKLNLGKKGEILFSQEKFYDEKDQSVVFMKVQERTASASGQSFKTVT